MRTIVTALVAAVIAVGTFAVSSAPVRANGNEIPNPCDFITGGGVIFSPLTMSKANFGVHGGCKHGSFWGHLNYVDHGNYMSAQPFHVRSTDITAYFMDLPNARTICGTARTNLNQDEVRFRVRMEDNDPLLLDTFEIELSNGYIAAGELLGGNIKLHKANPSTTPPTDPVDLEALCPGIIGGGGDPPDE